MRSSMAFCHEGQELHGLQTGVPLGKSIAMFVYITINVVRLSPTPFGTIPTRSTLLVSWATTPADFLRSSMLT